MDKKSFTYMLIGAVSMFVAVVLAVGGFVGGVISVAFIAGLISFIVGIVKWRSLSGERPLRNTVVVTPWRGKAWLPRLSLFTTFPFQS